MTDNGESWKAAFPKPDWEAEDVLLYCGDCLEILPKLPDKCVDAVVTDPPYGIGVDTSWLSELHLCRHKPPCVTDEVPWGDEKQIECPWLWQQSKRLVWGHPYILDPTASGWMVWDKQPGLDCERTLGQPVEMASTTFWCGFRIVRHLWAGFYKREPETRYPHPTQKPLRLMRRCVELAPNGVIADPFMGTGTTLVAGIQMGRRVVGVEIDPDFFAIAVKRIEQAIRDEAGKFAFAKAKAPDPQMELIPKDG